MTIRTASLREVNKLPKSAYKVVVMRWIPLWKRGIKAYVDEFLPVLGPSVDLLKDFKVELKRMKGGYKDNPEKGVMLAWNLCKYDSRFRREILHNPEAIKELKRIRDISRQLKGRRVVYLICCEPTDDYCHRRILKELMEKFSI